MATEMLKTMKEQLMSCVQGQLGDLSKVNAQQLGEAVDMIKDLSEAIYYCTITDSMEKADKNQQGSVINYYTTPVYEKSYPSYYRDMERNAGYMYYPGGNNSGNTTGTTNSTPGGNGGSGSVSYFTTPDYGRMQRDPREGRAAIRRRMYMQGKEMHKDTNSQLHELEAYLQELSSDITEMIKDASPEERTTLRQKMTTLADKIM